MIVVDFMFYLHKIHRDHGTARDRGMRSTTIMERRWRGARAASWNGAGAASSNGAGAASWNGAWDGALAGRIAAHARPDHHRVGLPDAAQVLASLLKVAFNLGNRTRLGTARILAELAVGPALA